MNTVESDKEVKKTIKGLINSINDLFAKNLGKKILLIRKKKEMIDYTFNALKSSDLYKEIKLEDPYTSEKDILNSFTGFFAGIEYAHYKKTTNGKITFLQYSKDRINELFKVSPNSFLTNTHMSDYKTALFNIVEDITKKKSN